MRLTWRDCARLAAAIDLVGHEFLSIHSNGEDLKVTAHVPPSKLQESNIQHVCALRGGQLTEWLPLVRQELVHSLTV
jgi:hypothetical protein